VKPEIKRYFIEIAYCGKGYHGWQMQNNAISVQEVLNKALATVLRVATETLGAGRTDTGVHAQQLYVHFDAEASGIITKPTRFLHSLNALLPHDIAVVQLLEVAADAHARFDATQRSYEYHVHFHKDPFNFDKSWYLRDQPDVAKMNIAAKHLLGKQDFSCFSKAHTQVFTNICHIKRAEWVWKDAQHLVFHITADRFLRNMVRAIVGTLLEIGIKGKDADYILEVIASQNRSKAGTSVPAHGLYLTAVAYPYINA